MEGGGASYIQGGRVPRDASIGSSRQQGPSVPSSETSERVNEVRVGAVTISLLNWTHFLHPEVNGPACSQESRLHPIVLGCLDLLIYSESHIQGTGGVRSQAKDSRKAKVEQSEFDETLSEQEGRLSL
jgi:hypothetical protein